MLITACNSKFSIQFRLHLHRGGIKGVNVIVDEPTDEFKQVHHVIDTPVQTFVVMADLAPEGL